MPGFVRGGGMGWWGGVGWGGLGGDDNVLVYLRSCMCVLDTRFICLCVVRIVLFGSDIFDTSLLLMFMSSCHKWNVALFHGFHLGFACCVVLAHVIVTI